MSWKRIGGVVRGCVLTAAVFLLISGGFRASGFTEVEFECEQAAAHIHGCCPDFPVTALDCNYESGCEHVKEAVFSMETSKCIQNLSCGDTRTLCSRLPALIDEAEEDPEGTGAISYPLDIGICPPR